MSFEIRDTQVEPKRAMLVGIGLPGEKPAERVTLLEELVDLVKNLGYGVANVCIVRTREIQAKYLCGVGKAEEIRDIAEQVGADCLIFDNLLSPGQQREWEKYTDMLVMDREEVILGIFAKRARTREAVMQVDLARMQYALPRMTGMWKHLDRQRGGTGGGKGGGAAARGEGEKQIEVDRRLAHERINSIRKELEVVRRQRVTQRKERQRQGIPMAAIVGYTNAGKSGLLNALTEAGVLVQDILFATLDTTGRRIELPDGQPLVLTDTVGFIRNLPHRLIEAFKSTLEEVVLADFLIHVVDVSDPEAMHHYETTCQVLTELGAGEKSMIVAANKTDKLPPEKVGQVMQQLRTAVGERTCLGISVLYKRGLSELLTACVDMLSHRVNTQTYRIPQAESRMIALMHRDGKVLHTEYEGNDVVVKATLPREFAARLEPYREK